MKAILENKKNCNRIKHAIHLTKEIIEMKNNQKFLPTSGKDYQLFLYLKNLSWEYIMAVVCLEDEFQTWIKRKALMGVFCCESLFKYPINYLKQLMITHWLQITRIFILNILFAFIIKQKCFLPIFNHTLFNQHFQHATYIHIHIFCCLNFLFLIYCFVDTWYKVCRLIDSWMKRLRKYINQFHNHSLFLL